MQLFSSYASLSWLLKKVVNKFDEIETFIQAWQQHDAIRANILAGDGSATKPACMAIIVNAQALNTALSAITKQEASEYQQLIYGKLGDSSCEWLELLHTHDEADCSRIEYQFRVLMDAVAAARIRVREFLDENLWPFLQSGALEAQACTVLQYHAGFHLAHLEDGFHMLEALLVHGLDHRCEDISAWGQRIESVISRIRARFLVCVDEPASRPSIWCCRGHRYPGRNQNHETLLTERISS
jgi:hypothetical protein